MSNKTIYKPKGKAGEYSVWACNLYTGCSNGCAYCYLKRGVMCGVLGASSPTLKKSLGDSSDVAYKVFINELDQHKANIIRDGGNLFFTFTSDPCLVETIELNMMCVSKTLDEGVGVVMLTKRADFLDHPAFKKLLGSSNIGKLSIGFTLTGRDDLEPNASANQDRIASMRKLHEELGVRTWGSIEPIIDPIASFQIIQQTMTFCDNYKIGIVSGRKPTYTPYDVKCFYNDVRSLIPDERLYWKKSLVEYMKRP